MSTTHRVVALERGVFAPQAGKDGRKEEKYVPVQSKIIREEN